MERLEQQFAFLREIDKEKMIGRRRILPMPSARKRCGTCLAYGDYDAAPFGVCQ